MSPFEALLNPPPAREITGGRIVELLGAKRPVAHEIEGGLPTRLRTNRDRELHQQAVLALITERGEIDFSEIVASLQISVYHAKLALQVLQEQRKVHWHREGIGACWYPGGAP